MSGSAVKSSSLLPGFSTTEGEAIGITLELEECRVMGGVLSLRLDKLDEPVESFLATSAMSRSERDRSGGDIFMGEAWYCKVGIDVVPDATGQAKSLAFVETCSN